MPTTALLIGYLLGQAEYFEECIEADPYYGTNNLLMVFSRHIAKNLLEWKRSINHKPLLIRDARQVGKTTLIK